MWRVAFLAPVLCGCSMPRSSLGHLEDLMGPEARVEAFRLRSPEAYADFPDWPVSAGPVLVPPASARRLAARLLDPASFSRTAKPCKPNPGVRVRWTGRDGIVDVAFCFECSQLFAYKDGVLAARGDFDPSARALAALIRPLFPSDPAIQALRD
jgi:hypothetical protein